MREIVERLIMFLFDKKLLVISENSYFIDIELDNIIALNSINKHHLIFIAIYYLSIML